MTLPRSRHGVDKVPPMRIALGLALVAALVAAGAQLADSEVRLAGSNNVSPRSFVIVTHGPARLCQTGETLYEDTAAVRMTIGTYDRPGPELDVRWTKDGRELARTTLPRGWTQGVMRIPLTEPPQESADGVTVCIRPKTPGRLAWGGERSPKRAGAVVDGKRQSARVSMLSELSGSRSLGGMLGRAASRYPAGNASWLGAWTFWLVIVLVVAALAAAGAALLLRERGVERAIPTSGWLCGLAGLLVCAAWAVLTPPFHVPDEISHTAYVQALVESHDLPLSGDGPEYSGQERALLRGLGFYSVIGRRDARPAWTPPAESRVRASEGEDDSREVSNATTASANPPLYYLLQAPIYWATPSTDLLDKLLPMRLLSALFGAITVLAIFLFLRELLPASPWLWPAGALACAFHPGFGFISGGINPDSLLFALGSVTFWLMAMILRRGPTPMRAAALAAAVAAGVLTKPLFLGLLPAAALALLVATIRKRRPGGSLRTALVPLGVGALVLAVPVIAYTLIGRVAFDHSYFADRSVGATVGTSSGSLPDEISYVWQLWLPRLPWQFDQFPGIFPLDAIWLNGFVGQFGWLDYAFPPPVHDWAVRVGVVLLVAAAISLLVNRARMRGRWLELVVYVSALAGVAVAIGSQDYTVTESGSLGRFTQARYLMPLLALYAGLIAVALRLGRRRVGPYLAVAVVTIAAVHAVSGMLLTIGRYYV